MNKYTSILCIFLLSIMLVGCKSEKTQKDGENTTETIQLPSFNKDSAFLFVKAQTDFGPRVPNSEAHELCGDYLVGKLNQYCDTIIVQPFSSRSYDGKLLNGKNIIGSFEPEKSRRILLAAHWDSRHLADHDANIQNHNTPIDGANDGASGVGVLLEIARQLQIKRPDVGIDIIFFDVEDYGTPNSEDVPGDWWCLGSQYWSKNNHIPNYSPDFGILLDMVGDKNAKFYHEGFSSHYAQDVVSNVWSTAYKLGFGNYFINQPSNPITDDHYYVNKNTKIRMINIVHQDNTTGTGFCPTWHTLQDNINNIDSSTLYAVGTTLLSVIYAN